MYFWAFPSKATQARKRKLDVVTEDRDKVAQMHLKYLAIDDVIDHVGWIVNSSS